MASGTGPADIGAQVGAIIGVEVGQGVKVGVEVSLVAGAPDKITVGVGDGSQKPIDSAHACIRIPKTSAQNIFIFMSSSLTQLENIHNEGWIFHTIR